jgi:predicted nucleotidyltransferase
MRREAAIRTLKRHRGELRAAGMARLSLFGSTARNEASPSSDIDLAAILDENAGMDLFRFAALTEQLSDWLGVRVDLVSEPSRNSRMQAEIDRDRVRVF